MTPTDTPDDGPLLATAAAVSSTSQRAAAVARSAVGFLALAAVLSLTGVALATACLAGWLLTFGAMIALVHAVRLMGRHGKLIEQRDEQMGQLAVRSWEFRLGTEKERPW